MNLAQIGVVLVAAVVAGQSQPQTAIVPTAGFEVASIKPVAPPYPSGGGAWINDHGRFSAPITTVRAVIAFSHGLIPAQVVGGPAWLNTDLYQFEAKAENPDAGPAQIMEMVRTLLADRFRLVVHRDSKEMQAYSLTVGKSGSKMQKAKDDGKPYVNWTRKGQVAFTKCNILGLIAVLSGALGSPVRDSTGLKGFYNFSLAFADPMDQRAQNGGQTQVDSAPDIFTAVQGQLGLKLESSKGPVEVLVIDHVERPSEN